mmetsp:Transcript_15728/g.29795  ORF Transcript_15728/g.29795 Transcript_15728/m.29795 type:complete len:90 (+) Transcript_15728:89-358(+)
MGRSDYSNEDSTQTDGPRSGFIMSRWQMAREVAENEDVFWRDQEYFIQRTPHLSSVHITYLLRVTRILSPSRRMEFPLMHQNSHSRQIH